MGVEGVLPLKVEAAIARHPMHIPTRYGVRLFKTSNARENVEGISKVEERVGKTPDWLRVVL